VVTGKLPVDDPPLFRAAAILATQQRIDSGLSSSAFVNDADIALSPSSAPSQANQALDDDPIRGCMIEPTRVTTLSTDDESPANPTCPSAA
jgi:hypothetical protein